MTKDDEMDLVKEYRRRKRSALTFLLARLADEYQCSIADVRTVIAAQREFDGDLAMLRVRSF